MTRHADDEVVSRAKRGDTAAWRALYREHAGRLLVWLGARPTGDAAITAEDLLAETWLVAAERIHDFTGTSDQFAGWLFGIARRLGANTHRRSQRRDTWATDVTTLSDQPTVPGPEPAYAAQDWVARALATLPERERDVVACREVVGLDVETTAQALGVSAVTVRVAHHRGLKRLRSVLGPAQDGAKVRSLSR